jgi:hypothetical protein
MTSFVVWCLASLSTLGLVARRDALFSSDDPRDMQRADACDVAIVLVAVDPADPVSTAIDARTGRRGFSHVYVDPCRIEPGSGRRMVVGYSVARGVHWSYADKYKPTRDRVRVRLDAATGSELWGCVRSRIGKPLHVESVVLGIDTASSCVGLIVTCLPFAVQAKLRALQEGPCVSPNTLARYFGVARR